MLDVLIITNLLKHLVHGIQPIFLLYSFLWNFNIHLNLAANLYVPPLD